MTKQKLTHIIVSAVTAVALVAYAIYVLVGTYSDVLITAQDRNMFAADWLYFSQAVARPFGLFQYVGGYLTQFFFNPAMGVAMLIAIWVASFCAGVFAFRLKGVWRSLMIVPVACLMASVVDLGYWVYCLNIPGYWFSQSVGYLCLLLLLCVANATPRRFRIVWYAVIGFAAFPFFGWFSYLFAICLALLQFKKNGEERTIPTWVDGVGITLSLVAPLVFHALLYEGLKLSDVYAAGFPFFKTSTDESYRQTIPFFFLTAVSFLMPVFGIFSNREWSSNRLASISRVALPCVVAFGSAYYVWIAIFKDDNYIYEMQMTQAAMNDDWKAVISVAEKTKSPSRTMVVLKNIALTNTGELGERSFELGNSGVEIYNPDSLNLNIMHIASPVIYYNYGKMNYSMRWCMEFAVPYGFSPYYLKNLARCAEVTGEKELAKRYTDRLNRLTFYADWKPSQPSRVAKELYRLFPDALDADDNNCERFLIRTFASAYDKESPLVTELSLFYSLIIRDASVFCPAFYDYAKSFKGESIPTAYEEAYCLFAGRFPERFPYKAKVRPSTMENYKRFMAEGNSCGQYASSEEEIGQQLFDNWGGTYWWFNAFGRNAY